MRGRDDLVAEFALLFPGQGAQYPGMGKYLWENFPESREVFAEADEVLDMPLSRLCFEGPTESLVPTEVQQPAILTVSVAALRVLERAGLQPSRVAGLSLGEYGALVAAGVLTFADAVALVRDRGRYMQEAVAEGAGAMAAVLGLDDADIEEVCRQVAAELNLTVHPANYNCPGQVVIAGDAAAVQDAARVCRERGARKVIDLPVSAPFHCALMRPAADRLASRLAETAFSEARLPVVSNVDAAHRSQAAEFPATLIAQVDHPVLWSQSMQAILAGGCDQFIELGPGRNLGGFMRRIDRAATVRSVDELDAMMELLAQVGEVC